MNPRSTLLGIVLFLCSVNSSSAQIKPGWVLRDELIESMESPRDTIYVENRTQLLPVGGRSCLGRSVSFSNKDLGLLIYIRNSLFNPKKHNLDIQNNLIDGKRAYGIDGTVPDRELTDIKIMWDTTILSIPLKALHNLYELYLCNEYSAPNVEAYVTRDGQFLYIYCNGSDGIASYSVKFVFNRKRFITRIVATIECMDQYDFLDGYGNCD